MASNPRTHMSTLFPTLAAALLLLLQPLERTAAIGGSPGAMPVQVRGDGDGDGVGDEEDRCPHTPQRAVAIAGGCGAIEIVANPELIGRPAQTAIATALESVNAVGAPGLTGLAGDSVRARLVEAQRQLDAGLRGIALGNVCAAAEVVGGGTATMEIASRDMADLVLRTREALQRTVSPEDPDADAAEVAFHEIGYRGGLVGKALTASRALNETVRMLCAHVVHEIPIAEIIARTDDAARIAQLRNGSHVAIADGAESGPVYERARVLIDGVRFADGTGVAKRVVANGSDQIDPSVVPSFAIKCMRLNIAPFQPFAPPLAIGGPYVLHEPAGYRGLSEFLVLEAPMRLAARSGGCATAPGGGDGKVQTFRYSLKLAYWPGGASFFTVFASDLTPRTARCRFPRARCQATTNHRPWARFGPSRRRSRASAFRQR